jgi:hypothetical protein
MLVGQDGHYMVVTDRWQRFSDLALNEATLAMLAASADEFLVHGVDVEGMRLGIDDELVSILGKWSLVCLLSLPLWKILQAVCQVISQALVMDCCKNLKSSSCVAKLLGMSVWVGQ